MKKGLDLSKFKHSYISRVVNIIMAGGVMQLVAVGAMDQFITVSPEMSFFKQVYKRHTNFSMESIRQTFGSKPTLDVSGNTFTCRVNRVADLLSDIYFSFKLPDIYSSDKFRFRWIENIAQYMIHNCTVRIDTQQIDQLWGEWMDVWNELSLTNDQRDGYNKLTGNIYEFNNPQSLNSYVVIDNNNINYAYYPEGTSSPSIQGRRFYMPIPFWFTKNPGLALPLVALQYQSIDITFELRSVEELYQIYDSSQGLYLSPNEYRTQHPAQSLQKYNRDIDDISGSPTIGQPIETVSIQRFLVPVGNSYESVSMPIDIDAYLECNFIFLDEAERRSMALNSHDYLVERVFRIEDGGIKATKTIDLLIQNPTKEIVWILRRDDILTKHNDWINYTDSVTRVPNSPILKTAKMIWNGMDRFEDKPPEYFNYVQPYRYHTRIPREGVYVYSFALYPEKVHPSGSFNASTVNKIQLYFSTLSPTTYEYDVVIYTKYYNVFRVMGGSGGMVFAN